MSRSFNLLTEGRGGPLSGLLIALHLLLGGAQSLHGSLAAVRLPPSTVYFEALLPIAARFSFLPDCNLLDGDGGGGGGVHGMLLL